MRTTRRFATPPPAAEAPSVNAPAAVGDAATTEGVEACQPPPPPLPRSVPAGAACLPRRSLDECRRPGISAGCAPAYPRSRHRHLLSLYRRLGLVTARDVGTSWQYEYMKLCFTPLLKLPVRQDLAVGASTLFANQTVDRFAAAGWSSAWILPRGRAVACKAWPRWLRGRREATNGTPRALLILRRACRFTSHAGRAVGGDHWARRLPSATPPMVPRRHPSRRRRPRAQRRPARRRASQGIRMASASARSPSTRSSMKAPARSAIERGRRPDSQLARRGPHHARPGTAGRGPRGGVLILRGPSSPLWRSAT